MMRALVFDGKLRFETDHAIPVPQADEALLRIRRAGICNTDLELMAGYKSFSGILGHEFVAVVEQGPEGLIGRRVVGEINVACNQCDYCARDIPSQCRNRTTVGIDGYPGAFADFLRLPSQNLHLIPDTIADDAAVFVEPLAAALQVIEAVHVSPRDRVIVLGAGKLGMLVAQVIALTGAELLVVVRREKQSMLLRRWGIRAVSRDELNPNQAQVVVDCTGQAEGFATALELIEPRGTIVLKSTFHGLPQVDMTRVAVNEIRVIGSRCGPFVAALRLLEAGLIDVEVLVEARYRFDDALSAVEYAAQKGMLKVLLDF
jgi:threonine dehydrogenase-like Zn-dependent dehydrogenase